MLVFDGVIVPNTQNLNSATKEQDNLILKRCKCLKQTFHRRGTNGPVSQEENFEHYQSQEKCK